VPTQQGLADVNAGWNYLATASPVLFDPNDAEFVKTAYADEQAMVPFMIQDPSVGLSSATDASRGAQLTQKFLDGVGDMITGRTPLSNLDQLVSDWRNGGGNQIRTEYQQAYADSMK
jgi:putative aldouronate transport system substrate-binding protein